MSHRHDQQGIVEWCRGILGPENEKGYDDVNSETEIGYIGEQRRTMQSQSEAVGGRITSQESTRESEELAIETSVIKRQIDAFE